MTKMSNSQTGPAMSKLFTSLEISPEDFITLQAAAKAYMLDENFPERSACVGTKAKLDTDMTKLRLYACVKTFLDQEGWGEKLFGENAPGGATRKNKWPQMQNKLVSQTPSPNIYTNQQPLGSSPS
jgi:hypothetical protein